MHIGIPANLAPVLFAQALSRLLLVYSAYSVIVAEVLLLLSGWHLGEPAVMWSGFLVGFPGFVLWWLMFSPLSAFSAGLYVVFLGITTTVSTWAVLSTMPEVNSTLFLPETLLGFALITVCGVAARTRDRVIWATLGFVAANVFTYLGSLLAGGGWEFDYLVLLGYVVVLLAVTVTPSLLKTQGKFQPAFEDGMQVVVQGEERTASARDVAAYLHDTLLSNLAFLSHTTPGIMSAQVRDAVESDLARLENIVVLTKSGVSVESEPSSEMLPRLLALNETVTEAEHSGLVVNVSGDISAVELLSCGQVDALVAALKQCLANVRQHSGEHQAEVVVLSSPQGVSVTVIDGGAGFDLDAVPTDRLGLRLSVRERIEASGGSVRIWSRPGDGAAVMMQFPNAMVS